MRMIMIDNDSSVDILYNYAYQRMDLEVRRWRSTMSLLYMGSTMTLFMWPE